jgi:uncharacterized membrane protein
MENTAAPEVRFGDWISEGWKMFVEQWKGWVTLALGLLAVVVVPVGAFTLVMYGIIISSTLSQAGRRGAPPEPPTFAMAAMIFGIFGLILVLMPLTMLLMGGMYRAAFKQMRGGRIEFRDLFSARDVYWRLLGAGVLHMLLAMVGAMLCIIPAFIVAGMLFFTFPLIVERNLGVIEAMKASREVTRGNLLMFILFAFVLQLIVSAGSYACYVGLLATYPLMFTISSVAYRDCFGVAGARSFLPQAAPPQTGYVPPAPVARPAAREQASTCPNCEASLPATAQFCPRCGMNVIR